jgi:hypothetical protein
MSCVKIIDGVCACAASRYLTGRARNRAGPCTVLTAAPGQPGQGRLRSSAAPKTTLAGPGSHKRRTRSGSQGSRGSKRLLELFRRNKAWSSGSSPALSIACLLTTLERVAASRNSWPLSQSSHARAELQTLAQRRTSASSQSF